MRQKKKKKNSRSWIKWIEYGLIIAFVALMFTKDLKAEVIGFFQRGLLHLGLFQPQTEQVDEPRQNSDVISAGSYDLPMIDQNGKPANLKDLQGRVVFINFWATWCAPCVAEMPNINALYQTYEDDGKVAFVMISVDENFDKAISFIDRKGFDFDVFKAEGPLPAIFDPEQIPATYVLAKNGELAFSHSGMGKYNTRNFKNMIEKLKAE